TYLADRSGALPFPDPIDQPLTADEVTAILSPFIAGGATAVAAATATSAAPVAAVAPPTETPTPTEMPTPTQTPTPEPAIAPPETAAPMTPVATRGARRNRNRNNANATETPTATGGNGGGRNRNRNNAGSGGNAGGSGGRNNGGGNRGGRQTPTPAAESSLAEPTPAAGEPTIEAASQPASGTATVASFGGTPGLDAVLADAASKFGVPVNQIDIVTNEPREWPSAALGCPQPGEVYAQVITPGYVVLLQSGDQRIEYHLDSRGNFVACKST
ncbi:MAG TPA: hypothetical protein VFQ80_12875, partial [Thermomicrobiales bacterium]|nr:hypothetical protein [Thermomicrobiales bacterium]